MAEEEKDYGGEAGATEDVVDAFPGRAVAARGRGQEQGEEDQDEEEQEQDDAVAGVPGLLLRPRLQRWRRQDGGTRRAPLVIDLVERARGRRRKR